MQKLVETPQKQRQQKVDNIRQSDQFVYNSEMEKYIGKRTGNYFCHLGLKENYDGFPRFSQYQSSSDIQCCNLALGGEDAQLKSNSLNKSTRALKHSSSTGLRESQVSSRVVDTCLPGFGQFDVNNIKRKSIILRPSQLHKNTQDIKGNIKLINEQEQGKKKKKYNRVSFKQLSIQSNSWCIENKGSEEITRDSRGSNSGSQLQAKNRKISQLIPIQEEKKRQQVRERDQNNFNIANGNNVDNCTGSQGISEKYLQIKQPQPIFQPQKQQQQLWLQNDNTKQNQQNISSQINNIVNNNQNKIERRVQKKTKKTKKKQQRITNEQNHENAHIKNQQKENKNKNKNYIQLNKKQIKIDQNQLKNKQKRKSFVLQIYKLSSSLNQHSDQKKSNHQDNNTSLTKRFPERIRIKPVQYWQSQKVHYRGGKAISIEGSTMSLKSLLDIKEQLYHRINMSLYNKDVQINLIIPPKSKISSSGVRDPYQVVEINMLDRNHYSKMQKCLNFDDGLRNEIIKVNDKIIVPALRSFSLTNKNRENIQVLMKLKAKIE